MVNLENVRNFIKSINKVEAKIFNKSGPDVPLYIYKRSAKAIKDQKLIIEGLYIEPQTSKTIVSVLSVVKKNRLILVDINYANEMVSYSLINKFFPPSMMVTKHNKQIFKKIFWNFKKPLIFSDFNFLNNPLLKPLLVYRKAYQEYLSIESGGIVEIYLKLEDIDDKNWLVYIFDKNNNYLLSLLTYDKQSMRLIKIEGVIFPNLNLTNDTREYIMEFTYHD
ncbi:MAG: hypothetical protein KDD58_07885 [Bdellovibrionales bacterium]|nr:hypothetical protein [Bdellovibrionales bacterium]